MWHVTLKDDLRPLMQFLLYASHALNWEILQPHRIIDHLAGMTPIDLIPTAVEDVAFSKSINMAHGKHRLCTDDLQEQLI
jgi:hypothetical protein